MPLRVYDRDKPCNPSIVVPLRTYGMYRVIINVQDQGGLKTSGTTLSQASPGSSATLRMSGPNETEKLRSLEP